MGQETESYPALLTHCFTVYDAMLEEAEQYELDPQYSVWTGFSTKLFEEHGLSVPYYTKVMGLLKQMDCIRQLRRGGSTTPSQWLLMQRPTEELYDVASEAMGVNVTRKQSDVEQLRQQLRDVNMRISVLEDRFDRAGL